MVSAAGIGRHNVLALSGERSEAAQMPGSAGRLQYISLISGRHVWYFAQNSVKRLP